jgi:predicted transposase/invertase (TIGR01784 family)
MKEAKEIFERAKLDPEAQETMRVYEKAAYDYGNDVSVAKREGRAEGLVEGEAIGLEKGEAIGLDKGRVEGLEEGKHEKARETAANFLAMGLSVEQVVQGTGLSLEEVQRLKNEK